MYSIYKSSDSFRLGNEHKYKSFKDFADSLVHQSSSEILKTGEGKTQNFIPVIAKKEPNLFPDIAQETSLKGVKYDVINYISEDSSVAFTTSINGDVRRKQVNIASVTSLFIDCDDITDINAIHDACHWFNEKGLEALIYSSKSYGIVKDGSLKFNFRIILPLSEPVDKEDWPTVFNLLVPKFPVELDKAFRNVVQYAVGPYHLEGNDWFMQYFEGEPVQTADLITKARAIDSEAKQNILDAEALRAEKRANRVSNGSQNGGEIDPNISILAQIDWDVFDVQDFAASVGAIETEPNKFTMKCTENHSSSNAKDLMIKPGKAGENLIVSCFKENCKYHGSGASNNFLKANISKIPSDAIKLYDDQVSFSPFESAQVLVESDEKHLTLAKIPEQFKSSVSALTEQFPKTEENCIRMVMAGPGAGKTHATALRIYDHLNKNKGSENPEVLLVVVGNKNLQDDLANTYHKIYDSNLAKIKEVSIIRSGADIKAKSAVVITHTTYLAHRGNTTTEYKLQSFINSVDQPLYSIIDELDSTISSLKTDLQIGYRYTVGESVEGDKDASNRPNKCVQCPTAMNKSYSCDDCHFSTDLTSTTSFMTNVRSIGPYGKSLNLKELYAEEIFSYVDGNETEESDGFDIVSSSLNLTKSIEATTVHNEKAHTLKKYDVREEEDCEDDEFAEFEEASKPHQEKYINWIKRKTTFPTLLQVNGNDKRKMYQESFSARKQSEDDTESPSKMWYSEYQDKLDKLTKDDEFEKAHALMLPHHPCNTMLLSFYDTELLKIILNKSVNVVGLSATYNETAISVLEDITKGIKVQYLDVQPEGIEKPIDEFLVITSKSSYKIDLNEGYKADQHDIMKNYVEMVTPDNDKQMIGTQFFVDNNRDSYIAGVEKFNKYNEFYTTTGSMVMSDATKADYKYYTKRTYPKSAFTRGYNAGENHLSKMSFAKADNIPMTALSYAVSDNSRELRNHHKINETIQKVGRIMRQKWDSVSDEVVSPSTGVERRTTFISDSVIELYNSEGNNHLTDISTEIFDVLSESFENVVKAAPIHLHVEASEFMCQYDFQIALDKCQTHFLATGEVKVDTPPITEQYFRGKKEGQTKNIKQFRRAYPNAFNLHEGLEEKYKDIVSFIKAVDTFDIAAPVKKTYRNRKKIEDFDYDSTGVTFSDVFMEKISNIYRNI